MCVCVRVRMCVKEIMKERINETYIVCVCMCEREREREKESVRAQRLNHFAKSILRFAEQQLDPVVGAANSKMLLSQNG